MNFALTPIRVETGFWLLLCAGLMAGIGVETDWGQRWRHGVVEVKSGPVDFVVPTLEEPFRLPAPDEFLETAMRPVFIVTRRPAPPPPPPEAPKPLMKKDQFTLSGITVVPEGKFAFLIEKAGNKSRVVSEGKEINGITVKEIRPDRVVLSQHDETETLLLKTAKGPATTTTTPVAAPGAAPPPVAEPLNPPPLTRPVRRLGAVPAAPTNGQATQ
jgi:hypothetical protein